MHNDKRRKFLESSAAVLATGIVSSYGVSAFAAEHEAHAGHSESMMSPKGVDAFVVDAKQEGMCATCRFWGGKRRVTEDKKSVYCESLGWCNNPESHHYQSTTTPATGPMKSWHKWEAL